MEENQVAIGLSIRAKIEIELDKYIKAAMEWPALPDPGPWHTSQDTEKALRDEIEKLKTSAAGRGLAIALWLIEGGDIEGNENARFRSPDAVIRDAVDRYRNPVPEDSHLGISPSEQAAVEAPASRPARAAGRVLSDDERAAIKNALDGGFDIDSLVTMFKVTREQIEACK